MAEGIRLPECVRGVGWAGAPDKALNRTRLEYKDGGSTTTTTYLYNTADQLTRDTVGGTNTDYLYDANGSLTKKDDGTNVHSYAYDFCNP